MKKLFLIFLLISTVSAQGLVYTHGGKVYKHTSNSDSIGSGHDSEYVAVISLLIDSVYVGGTTNEVNIDTAIVPTSMYIGRMMHTSWHGFYNKSSGLSQTFTFRIKYDSQTIDSVVVTAPAGGAITEQLNIDNTILFKSVGAFGRIHSATTLIAPSGIKINSNYKTVNTNGIHYIVLSIQISSSSVGNNFTLENGYNIPIN